MDVLAQLKSSLANRYDIRREIGRGGMATVYLAHDVRHDRNVALKVLNPELGAVLGGERFLSEIRVTANLQHPNLLPLFDSGEADGLLYYVMPFVEGESLRARLTREKQLPVDEAVRIASSIASALDYAHAHGVIHRDLKPENILLQAGPPVLADFGIALAVANAGGARITQTGVSLGTPQYTSPEQATGDRVIDGRTDIYSLGAVLYEMLTGDPPHTGSTAQAIIARVLTDKPRSVRATRETVSPQVEAAVERALAKLPADRFATAREFVEALEGSRMAGSYAAATPFQETRLAIAGPLARLRLAARRTALTMIAAAGIWGRLRPIGSPAPRARFTLELPDSVRLRENVGGVSVALSPDGSQFVYVGGATTTRLYLRRLNELSAVPIPGTERAVMPRFSPDHAWLAYVQSSQLKKIALAAGPAVTIADSVARYAWGDGDVIVFGRQGNGSGPLYRVSAAGGPIVNVTTLDSARGETGHTWPEVLPGGKAVVFTIQRGAPSTSELAAVRLDGGKPVYLGVAGTNPRYVSTGHILFGRLEDGSVAALPFDARRLEVTGSAVTILKGVVVKFGGATEIAVSRTGTLAYIPGDETLSRLERVDRSGTARSLLDVPQRYGEPRISPDGKRIAFVVGELGKRDVWVYHLSGTLTRLTRDGNSLRPVWTSDGRRLAWVNTDSAGETTRWQAWDGSGAPETLSPADRHLWIADFSRRDSSFVLTTVPPSGGASDIWMGSPASTPRFQKLLGSPAAESQPKVSPDGKWLVYVSDESGRSEVYVTPISNPTGRHQITTSGGSEPVWAPDGKTLFYRTPARQMMAATLATSPEFVVTRRETLFADIHATGFWHAGYDVFPDGKEFVMVRSVDHRQRAVVVFGWLDELRERMALAGKR